MTALLNRPVEVPRPAPVVVPPQPVRVRPTGVVTMVLAVVATIVVGSDMTLPVVRPLAGLFLLVLLPTYIVLVKKDWPRSTSLEAVLYSFAVVLLGLMVGSLLLNETLPWLGVERPLDRIPILVGTDTALLALTLWRRKRWRVHRQMTARALGLGDGLATEDRVVLIAASVAVLASVAGAIRLNNDAGGQVTAAMLWLAAAVVVLLLAWRQRLLPVTIVGAIYLLSSALLLMTSLRGWGIIGHDSQLEFYVYQLTKNAGTWQMESFQSAYNACLSINILPTALSVMTNISGAYVFKVLYPLAFAACPVIVYLIARRFGSPLVAILSAVYFIGFPTFFTDMPFLNRQALALLFAGVIVLVATNSQWTVRRRKMWVAVLSPGLVLSHYSTTYVLIAIFVMALGMSCWGAVVQGVRRWVRKLRAPGGPTQPRVLGLVNIAVLVTLTVAWTGPITHTGGQVEETTTRLVGALFGGSEAQRSSDVGYSLFSGQTLGPEVRFEQFLASTVAATANDRAAGVYHPLATVEEHPAYVIEEEVLPLTILGRALDAVGIDVPGLNSVVRQGAARLLQVFICVGLMFVLLGRMRGLHASREVFCLALGAFVVVLMQVVLPALSADYGVLRAFQQSLFVLAPFLVAGSIRLFEWMGSRRAEKVALAVAVTFFLSLTGAIPQALGGYAAQLHLNNSGEYYNLYYTHVEEAAAADFVEAKLLAAGQGIVQTQIPGRLIYGPSASIGVERTVFPALVRPQAYVLLGSTAVTRQQATVSTGGDRVTYRYPIAFLDQNMDLIYSNGRAVIYR